MLAERTDYLSAGVHIGMKSCTKYLRQFVYKVRDDGLAVFNLRKVDARISIVANFLSGFDNVLVVSRKNNAADAITKFAEVTGSKAIAGRFSPGTLTNPSYRDFFEPDVVVSIDGLKHVTSSCMENVCQTLLEFNLDVDVDVAANDVREKLDLIANEFPKSVEKPKVIKFDINAKPIIFIRFSLKPFYQPITHKQSRQYQHS